MPADRTRISGRFATIWRNNPSAIGLRQTFPVQTNKIFLSGLKARKGAMFTEAVQGSRIGVSAYRRGDVSAYRRIGVGTRAARLTATGLRSRATGVAHL